MAESKDEAAGVLQLLKTSDDPSPHDAARVRAAVWARIGLAGAVTTAAATSVHTLSQGADAALHAAASGINALSASSTGGALGSSLATGAALGAKAAWVVTVAKVGLAVALFAAGGWYGSRALTPAASSEASAAIAAASEHGVISKPIVQPVRARLFARAELAVATPVEDTALNVVPTAKQRVGLRADALDSEVALLADAQRALSAGQYSAALASLDKHAARFPRGALASERDASRAIAFCRSGALVRGRKLATRYVDQHASSPLCTRVRAACKLND